HWLTPEDTPIADAPAWLTQTLREGKAKQKEKANANPTGKVSILTVQADEDLISHAGSGDGLRNSTLCRLVGIHLARGESQEAIEALALAWAERCSPPYDEQRARDCVRQLAAKHESKAKPKAEP